VNTTSPKIAIDSDDLTLWNLGNCILYKYTWSDNDVNKINNIKQYCKNKELIVQIKGGKNFIPIMNILPQVNYIFFETDGKTRADLITQYKELKMTCAGFKVKIFCKIIGISAADLHKCVDELKYYNCDGLWFNDDQVKNYRRISLYKFIETYRDNMNIWVDTTNPEKIELPIEGVVIHPENMTLKEFAALQNGGNYD
jgi:hypothetical protein